MSSDSCSIEGCNRKAFSRTWCQPHYQHWRKQQSEPCSIEGCNQPVHSRTWCAMHYQRWYSTGSLEAKPKPAPLTDEEQRQRAEKRRQYSIEYSRRPDVRKRKTETRLMREKDPKYLERRRNREREKVKDPGYVIRREEGRRRRNEENKDYILRQRAAWLEKRQSIPSPRNGEPWTTAENDIACRNDISIIEMCYMLGRSYCSILNQRKRLLYGSASIPKPPKPPKGKCSVKNCERQERTNGWCQGHYQRWYLHGDVQANVPFRKKKVSA